MAGNKNNVGDIFRRINMFNEISQKAKEADLELTNIRKTILEETKEGLKEIEQHDVKDFMTYAKEAIGQVKLEVFFKKLDERAVVPTYAHDGDVGMDMTAIDVEYDKDGDAVSGPYYWPKSDNYKGIDFIFRPFVKRTMCYFKIIYM